MYLSAERVAIANQAVQETFEQTSVAWQAIPHWETGDPGQMRVRDDIMDNPGFLTLLHEEVAFQVTVVQANAPTPDSLLNEVMSKTVELAKTVDLAVLQELYTKQGSQEAIAATNKLQDVLDALIRARATVEDEGYRAPSCLFTNTTGLIALSDLSLGYPPTESVLTASNVNSLHRVTQIDAAWDNTKTLMLMLGRRQRIAHGGAPNASPGEEPVDLAVSVVPSLEVVGEAGNSMIELAVRIGYATRVKDEDAIVAVVGP